MGHDDDDVDFDEGADEAIEDWEDEDELIERQEEEKRKKAEEDEKRKEELTEKKREKQARLEAAKGNVDDDEDDIDQKGEKEYKDRLARHDVELTYGVDSNQIEAKPLAVMKPESAKDFDVMGNKIGDCMRTFRTNKFFFYAVNLLVTKACDKMALEEANDLQKKLNVIHTERTKAIKDSTKKKLKEEEQKEAAEAAPSRGNNLGHDSFEGRNDLRGDGGELDDFM